MRFVDIDGPDTSAEADGDVESFEYRLGLPAEPEPPTQQAVEPSKAVPKEPKEPKTKTPTRRLIPASHWPDEVCKEHDGVGWEVEVTNKKPKQTFSDPYPSGVREQTLFRAKPEQQPR